MTHPRHVRILAQYTHEYIESLLIHDTAPRELADMTTYRLDCPAYMLEGIDGVLADSGFSEVWGAWKVLKHRVETQASPAWEQGYSSYVRACAEGRVQDAESVGMRLARAFSSAADQQMWFYEGWLFARDEDA
jgi:hypothetical protein